MPGRGSDAAAVDAAPGDARRRDASRDAGLAHDVGRADRAARDSTVGDMTVGDVAVGDTAATDAAFGDRAGPSPPTHIYRSVGPGRTGPIADSSAGALTVLDGVAETGLALPASVGVGDILVYNATDGSSLDTIAMVVGRSSPRTLQLRAVDGTPAIGTRAGTAAWQAYRAYTSLADALAGQVNQGLSDLGFASLDPTNDLVAANQVRHLACYADALDTAWAVILSWTTSAENYLHIFAPYRTADVGTRQRHAGTWQASGAYTIQRSTGEAAILVRTAYVSIEGLQIDVPAASDNTGGIGVNDDPNVATGGRVTIAGCIIRGAGTSDSGQYYGIDVWRTPDSAVIEVRNNIIYGFRQNTGAAIGIWAESGRIEAYHNTVVDCSDGARVSVSAEYVGSMLAANNIFAGCDTAAIGNFLDGTDHNGTDLGALGYSVSAAPTHDVTGASFEFVALSASNFHLRSTDLGARNRGRAIAAVVDDIDGDRRPLGIAWDLGADEVP